MSRLIEIRAEFECDGCGRTFSVRIEPESQLYVGSAYDLAVDAVRGSIAHKGPRTKAGLGASSYVEGDQCYCGACEP